MDAVLKYIKENGSLPKSKEEILSEIYRPFRSYLARDEEKSNVKCAENRTLRVLALSKNYLDYHLAISEWSDVCEQHKDTDTTRCLCGHYIKTVFTLKNKETGVLAQFGSECIKELCPKVWADYRGQISSTKKQFKQVKKQLHLRFEALEKQRQEERERQKRERDFQIAQEAFRIQLRLEKEAKDAQEAKRIKDNRMCECCKDYTVPKSEPPYKTVCKACYAKSMRMKSKTGVSILEKQGLSSRCMDCSKEIFTKKPRCLDCYKVYSEKHKITFRE